MSNVDAAEVESLALKLRVAMTQVGFEPGTLPRIAVRLLALTRQADIAIGDMQKLLEEEPRVAARVLKVASSPHYSGLRAPSSLQSALVRLGVRTVRDLALEASADMVMLRPGRFASDLEMMWRHCRTTAHLARIVGRYANVDWDDAFLCGLVHDVGVVACLAWAATNEPSVDTQVIFRVARMLHEEAGVVVARRWELPDSARTVLGHHHRLRDDGTLIPMAAVVAVADAIAREVSPIDENLDGADGYTPEEAIEALGLSPEACAMVRSQAVDVLSALDA